MRVPVILAACLAASPALADAENSCIASAAARLPKIPGIEIVTSKADVHSREPMGSVLLVQIDTKAAGRNMAFKYVCAYRNDMGVINLEAVR